MSSFIKQVATCQLLVLSNLPYLLSVWSEREDKERVVPSVVFGKLSVVAVMCVSPTLNKFTHILTLT